jgi:hypothetical protein
MSQKQAEKQFKATQINDAIKNKYAADNNIPLLRIPYTEFKNIETILTVFLREHGVELKPNESEAA